MPAPGEPSIDVADIERAVRDADPAAWVVPPRILRRVIKRDRGLTFLGPQIPHRNIYAVSGKALRPIVAPDELGLAPDAEWPETVILLARPDRRDLLRTPRGLVLAEYWRMLFHARIHAVLEKKRTLGELSEGDLRARIGAIGPVEYEEARSVLQQEAALLPPGDDPAVYVEFAAYYLELRRFAPGLLPHTFPGIEDPRAVESLLTADIDEPALFAATRLRGADEPRPAVDAADPHAGEGLVGWESGREPEMPERGAARRLIRRASAEGERGNVVRSAILRTRAARHVSASLADSVRTRARAELDRLVRRLQRALAFDDAQAAGWSRALAALLERASHGLWTAEARLLFDLQKVCVDHEREAFRIDLVAWVLSMGRRPLRRRQPHLREVMTVNHLRAAARRLRSARLAAEERSNLAALLRLAVERAERVLRDRFRGPIGETLEANGIRPANLPERVAYEKLIEELLDRIAGRGFLSLGDLRDACSRSNLKMPDLSGPTEFFRGDRLLRVDRALALSLDGVYRRGEVYLRWLQRLSALAFATPVGRFLTLYVALPFGGAFVALEGLQHLVGPVVHWLGGGHVHIMNPVSLLILGGIALGAVNFLGFRHRFLRAARGVGRLVRLVLFDAVVWLLRQPLFRLLFAGRAARVAWRYLLKPGLIAAPAWAVATLAGLENPKAAAVAGVTFAVANFLLNSRLGHDVEEIIADQAVRAWRVFFRDLVPGLFRLVMETFDKILETVDSLLYAVDEYLRFRTEETRLSIAVKAVLGAIWFFVAYLIRIYVNLLIEPQVNPIKHFPVVTVSHKVILPLSLTLTRILAAPLMPLGPVVANFIAGTTVLLLPGVFGFLVWELKENWRLYEANRREALGKVIVGGHGETLVRLLRPGFHSGTLPKVFAKLRKSERRELRDGRQRGEFKHSEALHHVEEDLARFVEREFLALVRQSRALGPLAIELAALDVSTNRIGVEFRTRDDNSRLRIVFEERSGRLIAYVARPGWLPGLPDTRRRALLSALAGLYKYAGVEWIREPARADVLASPERSSARASFPLLYSFQDVTITWRRWVEVWERDQAGAGHPPRFIPGIPLLPAPGTPRGKKRRPSRR